MVLLEFRYRLVHPSSLYSGTYASVQTKFDLAVRCRATLCQQPGASVEAVQRAALGGQQLGGSSNACYQLQQLQAESQFLAGQMKALQQVCIGSSCI